MACSLAIGVGDLYAEICPQDGSADSVLGSSEGTLCVCRGCFIVPDVDVAFFPDWALPNSVSKPV
ncbi:MAG: hypothetical protein J6T28_04405 [Paludibacteraceae bacterium]|nr:hypothetical protein [Paludibacteraceae bacterium]